MRKGGIVFIQSAFLRNIRIKFIILTRNLFVMSYRNNSKIEKYEIVRKVAKGRFSIYQVRYKGQDYALKIYPFKEKKSSFYFKNESRFLNLNHPNIITILEAKEETKSITGDGPLFTYSYIVMEYAPYGDFLSLFTKMHLRLDEKLVRTFFHQLVEGVEYLHSNGISHMDLKPDNLLIGKDYQLKIADFDLAYKEGDMYIRSRGTKHYRAPEILRSQCKDPKKADIYSLAIILFIFKTNGRFPQKEGEFHKEMDLYALLQNDIDMFWENHAELLGLPIEFFSPDFKELFYIMTREDPEERATIADIKKSSWYRRETYNQEQLKDIMRKALSNPLHWY